jgi:hypothetical protein
MLFNLFEWGLQVYSALDYDNGNMMTTKPSQAKPSQAKPSQ